MQRLSIIKEYFEARWLLAIMNWAQKYKVARTFAWVNNTLLFLEEYCFSDSGSVFLTLEALKGGGQINPPSILLAINVCSLTDCQKLWHNCSLFVNTSFDTN